MAFSELIFDSIGFPITALRETNILLALRHPNIVFMKEMVVGSSVDKVFMVMEYLENDLKYCMDQMTKPFTLSEVIFGALCLFTCHIFFLFLKKL